MRDDLKFIKNDNNRGLKDEGEKEEWDDDFEFDTDEIQSINKHKGLSEWDEDLQHQSSSEATTSSLFDSIRTQSSATTASNRQSIQSLIDNNTKIFPSSVNTNSNVNNSNNDDSLTITLNDNSYLSKFISIDNNNNNTNSSIRSRTNSTSTLGLSFTLPSSFRKRHSRHQSFTNPPLKQPILTPPISSKSYNPNNQRARRNSLGDLRIPHRVKVAQQGLKIQLGSVREFARGVDQLRSLKSRHNEIKSSIPWPSNNLSPQLQSKCSQLDFDYADNWEYANVLIELASGSGVVPIAQEYQQNNLPRSLTTSPANLNSIADEDESKQQSKQLPPIPNSNSTTNNNLTERQLNILKEMLSNPPPPYKLNETNVHFNNLINEDEYVSPRGSTSIKPSLYTLNSPETPLSNYNNLPNNNRRSSGQSRLRRASKAGLNSFKDLIKAFVGSTDNTSIDSNNNTLSPSLKNKQTSESLKQKPKYVLEDFNNLSSSPKQSPPSTPAQMHRKRPSLAQLFSATRKASSSSLARKSSISSQTLKNSSTCNNNNNNSSNELDLQTPTSTPTKVRRPTQDRSYSENASFSSKLQNRASSEGFSFPITPINRSESTGECRLNLTPDALPQLLGHLNLVKFNCEKSIQDWSLLSDA